jgi:thiamine pyrophosphate-dependent acetolactate synthase large subunit-like protein
VVKRYDCLKLLASWTDKEMITVTSRGAHAREWAYFWKEGANFFSLNMGMCVPFAVGLTLAFPKRKVIAIDSDGSLLLDISSLVTVADVNPPNFLAIVFDNQGYSHMGATATARGADLEKMAQGAGIKMAVTIRTIEEFESAVKKALGSPGPSFFVAKVEPGKAQVKTDSRRIHGRPMKEAFVEALLRHPDYQGSKE